MSEDCTYIVCDGLYNDSIVWLTYDVKFCVINSNIRYTILCGEALHYSKLDARSIYIIDTVGRLIFLRKIMFSQCFYFLSNN